ncbi:UDP-N-acetylglucosamine transferase subunit ALG14 homolog [Atheta coriaria]|uniref:UDP-N-acetylglucosamine transferase subunit ALG14 homolog n=1 Tax=Dalotia coriaria TaxID=877792 RepID=UPI0031F40D4F
MEGTLFIEVGILIFLIILVRVFYLIHKITTGNTKIYPKRMKPAKTLICIGSGGHTTEMLTLMESLDFSNYTSRHYIMASSDSTSISKVNTFESHINKGKYSIKRIPRSRHVHQSYISSVFTTIYATLHCIPVVLRLRPDLILCNGPGTCIPICIVAFIMKVAFLCDTKIVFIESFCRTQTFSLSGKILIYVADNILVQWPSLKRKLKRSDYIGQLM